tara:strand:- start:458 stop:583 length:126 start_codon:yes stop_codon:yes gene_type:complete
MATITVTYEDGEKETASGDANLIGLILDYATANGYSTEMSA